MTIITGSYTTGSAVGNRQEIDDIVSRITPEDTPVYSMIGKGKTRSTSPEWETDTLRAPAANAQLEGDEYLFRPGFPRRGLKNYTQILRQGWVVTNTQEAIDNVGNVEKFAEKKIKIGGRGSQGCRTFDYLQHCVRGCQTRVSAGSRPG